MGIDLRDIIRDIQDFPIKGILFRDITPILLDGECFAESIRQFGELTKGWDFCKIAGPESRGFIFGTPLACGMKKGFIPVRKKGKLPYKTVSKEYELEYGSAVIEIHEDAIAPGERVVIVDDLLATGGTCKALCEMIEAVGGVVAGIVFLIELVDLGGRKLLEGYDVQALIKY
jgi:adenine phosphoribosyltransferase